MKRKDKGTEKGIIFDKKDLTLPKQGILGVDGKVLTKDVRKLDHPGDDCILCIYTPNTWPFVYRKFFNNFLRIIHPRNIAPLRKLGITDYFTLVYPKFPVCRNRNEAVQVARKHKANYMMFLDSDMQHPPDIILKLASHKLPIVSGMYFHQSPPHLPVVYKRKVTADRLYTHYWDYPRDQLYDADLIGMGCVFVDMRVFDEMEMPYFAYDSTREDGIVDVTEDVPFCEKSRQAGFSIMVDPSIQCTHISIDDVSQASFDAYMEQYHTYQKLLDKFGDGVGVPDG